MTTVKNRVVTAYLVAGLAACTPVGAFVQPASPSGAPAPVSPVLVPPAKPVPAVMEIGLPAAPVNCAEWLTGTSVSTLEKGTVYVIDFVIPQNAGARRGIAATSAMAARFKGKPVTFVTISLYSGVELNKAVLAKLDAPPLQSYGIDRDVQTARAYLSAKHNAGVPSMFIVDKQGVLAWMGRTGDAESESVILQVLDGKHDNAKAAKAAQARADKLVERGKKADAARLAMQAQRVELVAAKDWPKLIAATQSVKELMDAESASEAELELVRTLIVLDRPAGLARIASLLEGEFKDASTELAIMAEQLVLTEPGRDQAGIDLGVRIADRLIALREQEIVAYAVRAQAAQLAGDRLNAMDWLDRALSVQGIEDVEKAFLNSMKRQFEISAKGAALQPKPREDTPAPTSPPK